MTSPIQRDNDLLETTAPLTSADKARFAYFGVDAKILPPLRILNPQHVVIGDYTAIREGCHLNAFHDLSFLLDYVAPQHRTAFERDDYLYDGHITIDRECQIGRFAFMSCTGRIHIEHHVVLSERVFVGDNNHSFSHPDVPIVQQPNTPGQPVTIGSGSWIGVGAAILAGVTLGRNTVVGANSVVREGTYPSHAVIAQPSAVVLYRRHGRDD
ncbi:MAG: acyltransferase [Actinobacteria bacterium]|nr:MAG: acyltransferase [Actinomycetota bacterium]